MIGGFGPDIDWDSFRKDPLIEPEGLPPIGSRVYKGFQGSGKTLSMVDYTFRCKDQWPDMKIFSNTPLRGIKYSLIKTPQQINQALKYKNGDRGVLILLDEAHLYFYKKNGISLDVLTSISQQRKNRRRIVFTTQIWEELDISLRKQVKEIVDCQGWWLGMQKNIIYDGESLTYDKLEGAYVANKIKTQIFKRTQEMGDRFDTLVEIVNNQEYNRTPTVDPRLMGEVASPARMAGVAPALRVTK